MKKQAEGHKKQKTRLSNGLKRISYTLAHFIKRVKERYNLLLTEYDACVISLGVIQGKFKFILRETQTRIWYRIGLNGKEAFILFDHELEVPVTVFDTQMYRKRRPYGIQAI